MPDLSWRRRASILGERERARARSHAPPAPWCQDKGVDARACVYLLNSRSTCSRMTRLDICACSFLLNLSSSADMALQPEQLSAFSGDAGNGGRDGVRAPSGEGKASPSSCARTRCWCSSRMHLAFCPSHSNPSTAFNAATLSGASFPHLKRLR